MNIARRLLKDPQSRNAMTSIHVEDYDPHITGVELVFRNRKQLYWRVIPILKS